MSFSDGRKNWILLGKGMVLVKNLNFLSRQLLFNIGQDMLIQVVVDTKEAFLHYKNVIFK